MKPGATGGQHALRAMMQHCLWKRSAEHMPYSCPRKKGLPTGQAEHEQACGLKTQHRTAFACVTAWGDSWSHCGDMHFSLVLVCKSRDSPSYSSMALDMVEDSEMYSSSSSSVTSVPCRHPPQHCLTVPSWGSSRSENTVSPWQTYARLCGDLFYCAALQTVSRYSQSRGLLLPSILCFTHPATICLGWNHLGVKQVQPPVSHRGNSCIALLQRVAG